MRKKVLLLLFLVLLFVSMVLYGYISSYKKHKKYYFPQIDLYMEIYRPLFDNYGYIVFSKDSIYSFTPKGNYLKVYKTDIDLIDFVFNSSENDKMYILDRSQNVTVKQLGFKVEKSDGLDKYTYRGIDIFALDSNFFVITIDGSLRKVYYLENSTDHANLIIMKPLRCF